MNRIVGLGTLVKDVDLRYTKNDNAVARFTVALRRDVKNKEGNYDSDFVNCVAYNQLGETISKYFKKGNRILFEGRLQSGSYENNKGEKVYTTDVVVERINFVDKAEKTKETTELVEEPITSEDNIPLPF